MITSDLIIRYTNGLYSTIPENSPRYTEFRDMFSSGQILSKEWLVEKITKLLDIEESNILIVGAWFGTLGFLIKEKFPNVNIELLDIDPRCAEFINSMTYNISGISAVTADMFNYDYRDVDMVINTSCEHVLDLKSWLDMLPKNTSVILQSNNFSGGDGHVNCATSADSFIEQAGLKTLIYSGELIMPMFTRYMIIGQT